MTPYNFLVRNLKNNFWEKTGKISSPVNWVSGNFPGRSNSKKYFLGKIGYNP
jgi:hypothetical protein